MNFLFLFYLIIPLVYFYFQQRYILYEKITIKKFRNFFGFKKFKLNVLIQSIILFIIILFVMLVLNYIWYLINPNSFYLVLEKITLLVRQQGYYIFFLIFIIAFSEELFFRVLLVDRFGIFISSLVFALMHLNYGSYVEIVFTFIIGIFFAIWWKKDRNIYELFLAHLYYDLLVFILVIW